VAVREDNKSTTDSVMMAIGMNRKRTKGSTESTLPLITYCNTIDNNQADSAIVAIPITRVDSVNVTIDSHQRQQEINNLPEPQEWETIRPRGTVQADSHSERPLHPIHSVGRSGESHLHATSYY
jgi:hypothetical protein